MMLAIGSAIAKLGPVHTDDKVESRQIGEKVESRLLIAGSRSALLPKLNMFNSVNFVESGWFLLIKCWTSFRLCRQCVWGQSDIVDFSQSWPMTMSNSTLSPVCTVPYCGKWCTDAQQNVLNCIVFDHFWPATWKWAGLGTCLKITPRTHDVVKFHQTWQHTSRTRAGKKTKHRTAEKYNGCFAEVTGSHRNYITKILHETCCWKYTIVMCVSVCALSMFC